MSLERMAEPPQRDIILGRHSTVWRALQGHPLLAERSHMVIGHRELPSLVIEPGDRVWVLSYSRKPARNSALLAQLRARLESAGITHLTQRQRHGEAVAPVQGT